MPFYLNRKHFKGNVNLSSKESIPVFDTESYAMYITPYTMYITPYTYQVVVLFVQFQFTNIFSLYLTRSREMNIFSLGDAKSSLQLNIIKIIFLTAAKYVQGTE